MSGFEAARRLLEDGEVDAPIMAAAFACDDLSPIFINRRWRSFFLSESSAESDCASIKDAAAATAQLNAADQEKLLAALRSGGAENLLCRVDGGDGRPRWAQLSARRAAWETRGALLCVGFDVTAHKRAEKTLLEAARRVQGVLDCMFDAVVTGDEKGRVVSFNRAAERLFGYKPEEILGQDLGVLGAVDVQAIHPHADYIDRYLDTGESEVLGRVRDVIGRRKDGSTFPLELSVSEMRFGGAEGRVGRLFVGVMRDVSDRRAFEDALMEARERAESASAAKSRFLDQMSHELRTPLNAVLGFSELLLGGFSGALNDAQRDYVGMIEKSGRQLLSVINDILEMSRLDAGKRPLDEKILSLKEILTTATATISLRAKERGVVLTADLEAAPRLLGDASAIKQMMLNLLDNAVKFTPEGGAAHLSVERSGCGATILVSDTGVGIAPELQERIFEPFSQAEEGVDRRYEGLGLGLTISRAVMALHGGRLVLDSAPGRGTVVRAEFPAWRVKEDK